MRVPSALRCVFLLAACTSPPVSYPEQVTALDADGSYLGKLDGDFRARAIPENLDAHSPRTSMYFHWAGYDGQKMCVTWNDPRTLETADGTTPAWYDRFAKSVRVSFGAFDDLRDVAAQRQAGTHKGRLIGGNTGIEITDADIAARPQGQLNFVMRWCAPSPRIRTSTRFIVLFVTYVSPPIGSPTDDMRAKKGDWGPDLFAWELDATPASMEPGGI